MSFGSDDNKALHADKDHKEFVEQIAALRDLKPSAHRHRTNLWGSVANTTQNPLPLQRGDVIFVITDGGDTASHIQSNELERTLYKAGIRMFGFALSSSTVRTDEELAGPSNVCNFARQTGGDCFIIGGRSRMSPQGRQEIQDTIVQFLTEAVQPYRIELAPSAAALSGKLRIEIVENGIERKDLVVLAPDRLFPTD